MTASLIDGKAYAEGLRQRVAGAVAELKAAKGITPGLAHQHDGEDPASQVYVRSKGRQSIEVGMASFEHRLPESTTQAEVLEVVAALNADPTVHGILVQLPLPRHIASPAVIQAIDPNKGRRPASDERRPPVADRRRRAARLPGVLHAAGLPDAAEGQARLAIGP